MEAKKRYSPPQRRLIRARIELLRDQRYSYEEIAALLNKEGITRPDGRELTAAFCAGQFSSSQKAKVPRVRRRRKLKVAPAPEKNSALVSLLLNCNSIPSDDKLKILRELLAG